MESTFGMSILESWEKLVFCTSNKCPHSSTVLIRSTQYSSCYSLPLCSLLAAFATYLCSSLGCNIGSLTTSGAVKIACTQHRHNYHERVVDAHSRCH